MAPMASIDELQKQHEAHIAELIRRLSGRSSESDWALVRGLIHQAVHLLAARKSAEYCALATYLAEMIGHAHGLMHEPQRPGAHADAVH